jgi:hypothetical protein
VSDDDAEEEGPELTALRDLHVSYKSTVHSTQGGPFLELVLRRLRRPRLLIAPAVPFTTPHARVVHGVQ